MKLKDIQRKKEKESHPTDTELLNVWMPRPAMVSLREIAHDQKCSVAHIVRRMIGHHLNMESPMGYIGRLPSHRF